MHLVPELDSKADYRVVFSSTVPEQGDRKWERVTEHSSPSELLCSSVSLWSSRAAGRRSQSAPKQERSKNKREGSSVCGEKRVHLLSLPYLKQRQHVFAKPTFGFDIKLANSCSGLMWMKNSILFHFRGSSYSAKGLYSSLDLSDL